MTDTTGPRPLTGRKVLAITLTAFGVILAANLSLLWAALGSFPGLEVANSYVASQSFDADRRAQAALGWTAQLDHRGDMIRLELAGPDGTPVTPVALTGKLGRATFAGQDQALAFAREGAAFEAPARLAPGAWLVWIEAEAEDGTAFRQRLELFVRDPR
ncbi:FixH family protein [Halovulum dunhuangense]|uniref:FixH family protein n=1 Tax=Halovulum dunhuangense TaxID=1505036 RepID=A0A849KPI7_9RHOB|nr:FixH family protein [Halovulum dunhuangense]NNU78963.1 FixH family protein [Halovulum dunhuangense]